MLGPVTVTERVSVAIKEVADVTVTSSRNEPEAEVVMVTGFVVPTIEPFILHTNEAGPPPPLVTAEYVHWVLGGTMLAPSIVAEKRLGT